MKTGACAHNSEPLLTSLDLKQLRVVDQLISACSWHVPCVMGGTLPHDIKGTCATGDALSMDHHRATWSRG